MKYRNKIPARELKAMFGYRPIEKARRVEVRDENGFFKTFDSMKEAAEGSGLSSAAVIRYVIESKRNFMKRRSDKKIFFL